MIKDYDKDGKADWMEIVNYFKSKGWTWGGDWKSFKDGPHFEFNFGFDWKTLKARVDKDIVIKDENGITYPKI
jgi:peptidoglycan L-alanyl-D-glutamate endopeptidase CwlK